MRLQTRFLAVIFLSLCLAGCSLSKKNNVVDFYYLRTPDTYAYGDMDAVIAPEQRDCSGKENNLHYLLTLYLEGPLDSVYRSPFPRGTGLESLEFNEDTVSIQLSSDFLSLTGMDKTLAAACLARTCFSLYDATQVHIHAQHSNNESVSFTLTWDDLVFMDGMSDTIPSQ